MIMQARNGTALIAMAVGIATYGSGAAVAQTPEAVPAEAAPSDGLQDIVVTAQRREERLQDVPISVSALTPESIRAAGVTDTNDLSAAVPGLYVSRQNASISPFIRGIGNKNTSPGEESAAALYVDGVYISSPAGGLFALNNIARVEVLKGPQGTLFGRNAIAGVIQIVTKDPSHDPSADVTLSYANYDTKEATLYATAGITDSIAADIAVYANRQSDGWGRNLTTGSEAFKGHELALRSKWLVDLGDNTKLTFAIDYGKVRPVTPPYFVPLEGSTLFDGVTYAGFFNPQGNRDVTADTEQWGANAQLRHDLGGVQFVSISSYRWVRSEYFGENDGIPRLVQKADSHQTSKTFTQEFQLLSDNDSRLSWIVGAFYYHDQSGYDPLVLNSTNPAGVTTTLTRFSTQTSNSYAGFGQATFALFSATKITAGLRYTKDERALSANDIRVTGPFTFVPQKANSSKLTWRFSIDQKLTEDILLYGSISRGYKSGVFNTVSPAAPAVNPETLDSYEIGLKSDLFDRHVRFNLAAFYSKFKDIQFQIPVPGATQLLNAAEGESKGFETEIVIAPVSHLRINAAATYLHNEYTDFAGAPFFTPLPTGGNALTPVSATGKDFVQSPHWTATIGAQYTIPTEIGDFLAAGTYSYNDGFFFDAQNRVRQPSYELVSASLGWTSPDGTFGARVWGKNLTDSRYYTNIPIQAFGDTAVPAAPRTYGLTLEAHF